MLRQIRNTANSIVLSNRHLTYFAVKCILDERILGRVLDDPDLVNRVLRHPRVLEGIQ